MGILEEIAPWLIAELGGTLSIQPANEHPQGVLFLHNVPAFQVSLRLRTLFFACMAVNARKFHDLRAMSMTKKQESEGGNPPSGREKSELSCLVLFTPRNNSKKNIRREKTRIRRIRHGIARAIEGLRGVRLSLVPCPDCRYGLLQGM